MYYIFICKFKYAGVCVIAIHYISKNYFVFHLLLNVLSIFIYKYQTLIQMVKNDI